MHCLFWVNNSKGCWKEKVATCLAFLAKKIQPMSVSASISGQLLGIASITAAHMANTTRLYKAKFTKARLIIHIPPLPMAIQYKSKNRRWKMWRSLGYLSQLLDESQLNMSLLHWEDDPSIHLSKKLHITKQSQNNIYLSVIVKVWIKTDTMATSCLQIHKRRRIRIILREVYIEFKTSIGIRSVCWTSY